MMMDDLEAAEQAATLGSFIGPLEAAGYASELLEVSPQLELPTLIVGLPSDDQDRGRWFSVNIVPFDLGEAAGLTVAQAYAPLPFGLPAERRAEFAAFALSANQMLPVGSIGARDDGELYFRYMVTAPDTHAMPPEVMPGVATLLQFQMDVFGAAIESVVSGQMTADQAIGKLTGED